MTYDYPDDNKLHTRYSELVKCTEGQIERVVENRLNNITFSTPYLEFGTERHKIFAEHCRTHKSLPKETGLKKRVKPEFVERSLAVEAFENVVIHFTPDVFGEDWICDFKTTSRGKVAYTADQQIKFYSWLLSYFGKDIKKGYYVCELWDRDRTTLQDYEGLEFDISKEDKESAKEWASKRVEILYQALTQGVKS